MQGVQVVVTGAGGFIGHWLVRELHERGAHVTALVRQNPPRTTFPSGVRVCTGDVTRPDSLRSALIGAEVVFHGAGLYRFGLGHRAALQSTNVKGTAHVLAAARHAGVRTLVYLGSAGVLSRKEGLIGPDDFPETCPRWSAYKASKWQAERLVIDAACEGLPARLASITCPLGAEDHGPTPTGTMVRDFLAGRFPFSTRTGLNFIGVRDLVRGLIAVAERGTDGQRYILGQENLSLTDFLHRLARLSGLSAPRLEIPWPLVATGGLFGEAAHGWAPDRSRRLCLETALQARRWQFFETESTRRALAWEPLDPLDQALGESLSWFRSRMTGTEPAAGAATATEPHVA